MKKYKNLKAIALEFYNDSNEKENMSYNEWLEVRINEGRLTLEEAAECGYVITISKTESKAAKVAAKTTAENNFDVIVNGLSKEYPLSYIMECVGYLNKKVVGTVLKYDLEVSNGKLQGWIKSTEGEFKMWQTTKRSRNGKEHLQMVVSKY